MKKLIVLILISNALFAQEKTKVDKPKFVSIYWKPLFISSDDYWAYGNKVGLGIEKRLSKKFDLAFDINNGNYTYSGDNVVSSYEKKSIVDLNLNARLMFSRTRRVNLFITAGAYYSTSHSYEIDYLYNEAENKNFKVSRDSHLGPYTNLGLRFGKDHRRFVVELTLIEYNLENGLRGSKGQGLLKFILRLK